MKIDLSSFKLPAAPDANWMPFLKMAFGFFLLFMLCIVAAVIALGKVEAQTSDGLGIILGTFSTLSGGFVGWAFREGRKEEKPLDKQEIT